MKRTTFGVLALGLMLAGCQTPIQGHYEYNTEAPWGRYASFAWVTSEPLIRPAAGIASGQDQRISPIMEQTIRRAVDRILAQKGYEQIADPGAADIIVSFSLGTRDKIEVDSYPVRAGYGYGRYGYGGGYYSDVRSYTEGTLAIDFFDAQARQAIWHGWASKRVSSSADQAQRTATLNEAVGAILKSFPFRKTQQ
jgi:hypothetical protein